MQAAGVRCRLSGTPLLPRGASQRLGAGEKRARRAHIFLLAVGRQLHLGRLVRLPRLCTHARSMAGGARAVTRHSWLCSQAGTSCGLKRLSGPSEEGRWCHMARVHAGALFSLVLTAQHPFRACGTCRPAYAGPTRAVLTRQRPGQRVSEHHLVRRHAHAAAAPPALLHTARERSDSIRGASDSARTCVKRHRSEWAGGTVPASGGTRLPPAAPAPAAASVPPLRTLLMFRNMASKAEARCWSANPATSPGRRPLQHGVGWAVHASASGCRGGHPLQMPW